jgi:hypothetical protein
MMDCWHHGRGGDQGIPSTVRQAHGRLRSHRPALDVARTPRAVSGEQDGSTSLTAGGQDLRPDMSGSGSAHENLRHGLCQVMSICAGDCFVPSTQGPECWVRAMTSGQLIRVEE